MEGRGFTAKGRAPGELESSKSGGLAVPPGLQMRATWDAPGPKTPGRESTATHVATTQRTGSRAAR